MAHGVVGLVFKRVLADTQWRVPRFLPGPGGCQACAQAPGLRTVRVEAGAADRSSATQKRGRASRRHP